MNFAESLALSSGLKLHKPQIEDLFFPIIHDKYITFSTEDHDSKQWDHFQEFIDLIFPILKQKNISIVEIGKNKTQFSGVTCLKGATCANHWSYIIKRSMLHIGPENFISQLCDVYEIPYVCLFSNTSPEYAAPFWSKKEDKRILLGPNKESWRPSFMGEEKPKTINTISAEEVAHHCLNLINIENNFGDYHSLNIGDKFDKKLIEIVPDFIPADDFFPKSLINIRLDYAFNPQLLPHFANNRKISIISDQEIDLKIIQQVKPNLECVFLQVDENSSLEYIKQFKKIMVPLQLIAKKTSNISATRFKFFDWPVEEEVNKTKKDLDNSEKICDTTLYKSSKYIYSKDGIFSSKSAYNKGIKSHNNQLIINDEDFWEEQDHFKLYNLNKNE